MSSYRLPWFIVLWSVLSPLPGTAAWFDNYQTYAAYQQKLGEYAATYPTLTTLSTIGNSYEGRAIPAIRITGTGSAEVAKKTVYLNGMMHAREWIAGMVPMYIADRLLTGYGTDPRITSVLDNTEFMIVPMSNPDGYEYSRLTNRFWRKNRRPNGDGSVGVDLNRNYGYQWGLNSGSSPFPDDETYRGTGPFSEPETVALRNVALADQDVVTHIDFHSYSQLILSPFSYTVDPAPDQDLLVQMAHTMADSIQDMHGKIYEWDDPFLYLASGTSIDWMYGDQGIYSYTIELRPTSSNPGFLLPANQILPTGQEMFPAVLDLAEYTMQLAGGDFDVNDRFECADIDRLVRGIVLGSNKAELDLSGDGLLDGLDVVDWLARAGRANLASQASYLPGDANLDGSVDGVDFNLWNSNKFTSLPSWCGGDFNVDGLVDGSDFNVWNAYKFLSADSIVQVPEPALNLLLAGLVAAGVFRRTAF